MIRIALGKNARKFDPNTFLATIGEGTKDRCGSEEANDIHARRQAQTPSSMFRKAK